MDLDQIAQEYGLTRNDGESDESLKQRIQQVKLSRNELEIEERNVNIPAVEIRAEFVPGSVDEEKRVISYIASTGERGLRRPMFDRDFYEELEISEKAIRMDRFNSGAPFLAMHRSNSFGGSGVDALKNQIGVIEDGRIENGALVVDVRYSERDDVEPIWQDAKTGILRNVSVGYRIHRMDEVGSDGGIPILRATDWEPMELSQVTVPFDGGVDARNLDTETSYPAKVNLIRSPETKTNPQGVSTMNLDERAAKLGLIRLDGESDAALTTRVEAAEAVEAQRAAGSQQPPAAAAPAAAAPAAGGEQRTDEGLNATDVLETLQRAGINDMEFATTLTRECATMADVQSRVIDKMAGSQSQENTDGQHRVVASQDMQVVNRMRSGITDSILHRYAPAQNKADENAQPFVRMSLFRICEEILNAKGVNVRNFSRDEIIKRAIATDDLAFITADVANKSLRAGYENAGRTFVNVFRRTSASDFKNINRTQMSGAPDMLLVKENGEFKSGEVSDANEQYVLQTYGRILPFTRQMIINDDLDAITRIPELFGRSAADNESDIVWNIFAANAAMGDGTALFHADHGNIVTPGTGITVDGVGAGRLLMRKQTGLEGRLINLMAQWMIVGAERETEAEKFFGEITPSQISEVRPEGMARSLSLIVEPRLAAQPWYLAAGVGAVDTIEYAYLNGDDSVYIETKPGFEIDGIQIKARHEFAAKAIDYRGLVKNLGN